MNYWLLLFLEALGGAVIGWLLANRFGPNPRWGPKSKKRRQP